eukprot:m.270355 g.270355  ORF g.270355 m.270355 type:complete len:370 (+) comp22830_c2_seq2:314-1423(+)
MTVCLESFQHMRVDAVFQADTALPVNLWMDAESCRIQCFLRIHAVINHVAQHLNVSLWLHESTHDAVACKQLAAFGDQARDDSVVRPLVRCQHIGVVFFQREVVSAVLQRKAATLRHKSGPKAHVVRVDEAAGVAPLIHHAELHRVAAGHWRPLPHICSRLPWNNQTSALGGVVFRQQLICGDVHHGGVGYIPATVGKGQAHSLNQTMQVFRRVVCILLHAKSFQDVEGNERGDALAVGGDFIHLVAFVVDGNGLHKLGLVLSQILQRHHTTLCLYGLHNRLANAAGVKGLCAVLPQFAEGLGHQRHAHQLTSSRCTSVLQQVLPVRVFRELCTPCPAADVHPDPRNALKLPTRGTPPPPTQPLARAHR